MPTFSIIDAEIKILVFRLDSSTLRAKGRKKDIDSISFAKATRRWNARKKKKRKTIRKLAKEPQGLERE